MAFKLTVFIALLIAIGVLAMRWYAASVRAFELGARGEARAPAADEEAGPCPPP